ncbi:MAG: hypothetical protein MPK62_06055 [Alphaproteobacteria bacterium]|nr:hypothetical protein [Nitrosopumilus sp.]MDA8030684.1 hypothetical protein [Alphaproteobacteria bacterium]
MDAIRRVRRRNGVLGTAIPAQLARAYRLDTAPYAHFLPADDGMAFRAHIELDIDTRYYDWATIMDVRPTSREFFVPIPIHQVHKMCLEPGRSLAFVDGGDRITARRVADA